MAKLLGAKIGNFHTLTDWGLYLKVGSPKIGAAEPEEDLVQVTGSDSLLNLTTWDDGKVHYKKRTITMELLCNAPKSKWPTVRKLKCLRLAATSMSIAPNTSSRTPNHCKGMPICKCGRTAIPRLKNQKHNTNVNRYGYQTGN